MDDNADAPVESGPASEESAGPGSVAPPVPVSAAPAPSASAPVPTGSGVGGATGCAPLAFTALAAALLGAVLALAMLAYVNNGALEFVVATTSATPAPSATSPATPDLRQTAAPLETRAAAAQGTAADLVSSVATLEAENDALARRLDIALTALGLPGLASGRSGATAQPRTRVTASPTSARGAATTTPTPRPTATAR